MISTAGVYRERIGGLDRALKLTNAEIDRFEELHPIGIFGLWDALCGRGPAPHVRHVRDLVALGLVGGGMGDRAADKLIADQGPELNQAFRGIAHRLLGVTFLPQILDATADDEDAKKNDGASSDGTADPDATTPGRGSPTSVA